VAGRQRCADRKPLVGMRARDFPLNRNRKTRVAEDQRRTKLPAGRWRATQGRKAESDAKMRVQWGGSRMKWASGVPPLKTQHPHPSPPPLHSFLPFGRASRLWQIVARMQKRSKAAACPRTCPPLLGCRARQSSASCVAPLLSRPSEAKGKEERTRRGGGGGSPPTLPRHTCRSKKNTRGKVTHSRLASASSSLSSCDALRHLLPLPSCLPLLLSYAWSTPYMWTARSMRRLE
jgi:hypothetical protein